MSRTIPLTRGYFAIVDDEDFEWLSQYKWGVVGPSSGNFYARHGFRENGKTSFLLMHRLIVGTTDPKIEVDHINGNTLDNRRANLRGCSKPQNQHNRKAHTAILGKPVSSQYKGVTYSPRRNKWQVQIHSEGKRLWLGRFDSEVEAARAYDAAAQRLYGAFARLNFPT